MRRSLFLAMILILVLSVAAQADEGMWMLQDISALDTGAMATMGLQLTPDQIYNAGPDCLAKAVIRLGGGTATFVSEKGLIITNHHVAFAALQKNATVDDNSITDGFWAKSLDREVPALGYQAFVLESVEEVTGKILEGVTDKMADLDRFTTIEQNEKTIVEACEAKGDFRCEVYAAYEGLEYYLVTYFMIRDVRIVYAPPQSIGAYGGDIDNWMWPRHTGDFAFMRAYVSPQGKSVDYDKANVPYKPAKWLPMTDDGVKDGDFTIMMGYPYQTERYRSSFSSRESIEFGMPWRFKTLSALIDINQSISKDNSEAAVVLANMTMRMSNYHKNIEGTLLGLSKIDLVADKQARENATKQALKKDKAAAKSFDSALSGLGDLYQKQLPQFKEKMMVLGWFGYFNRMLSFALTVEKWSSEKEKPDMEREPEFMDRNQPILRGRLKNGQKDLYVPADKAGFKYFIKLALALPQEQRIKALDSIIDLKDGDKAVDALADLLYDHTRLGDQEARMKMMDMSREELKSLKDSMVDFALALRPEIDEMEKKEKSFDGAVSKLRPKYIAGLLKGAKGPHYPDANYSMRFSYGTVKGYSPKDGVWNLNKTTLTGLGEKNTGVTPFDAPQALLDAYAKKDYGPYYDADIKDLPINFLSTNDGTGGNSGSAIIDGRGRIAGLIFDTNFEAVASDYVFLPRYARAINVDARYILFLLDKVYDVNNVFEELTVE